MRYMMKKKQGVFTGSVKPPRFNPVKTTSNTSSDAEQMVRSTSANAIGPKNATLEQPAPVNTADGASWAAEPKAPYVKGVSSINAAPWYKASSLGDSYSDNADAAGGKGKGSGIGEPHVKRGQGGHLATGDKFTRQGATKIDGGKDTLQPQRVRPSGNSGGPQVKRGRGSFFGG